MKLCMFHPVGHPMERGWVGRIDGDRMIHLAAQTLQSFFTGGGSSREHAVYPLEGVKLLAPVLHPPAVRVFVDETSFAFANPAAIRGPDSEIDCGHVPGDDLSQSALALCPRVAAVVGAGGVLGGFTAFAEWLNPALSPPKDRDFALGLGPVVVTPDALDTRALEVVVRVDGEERLRATPAAFDWESARDLAARGTALHPGDVLAGPPAGSVGGIDRRHTVELDVTGIGVLRQVVA